jgi:hypothetical protein
MEIAVRWPAKILQGQHKDGRRLNGNRPECRGSVKLAA